jgi:Family of unknown function (DUF6502)
MSSETEKAGQGDVGSYAYEACARMLRPVVMLALRFGLKYHDMDTMMKRLLLEEAGKELERTKGSAPSASQLSVTTGVHRKEIRKHNEMTTDTVVLPSSEKSIAALVSVLWLRRTERKSLPIQTKGDELSFEKLVLQTGKDVHFRSVLSELIRLGLVEEIDGEVQRLQSDFVPHGAEAQMLGLAADNVYAHTSAAAANVNDPQRPFLEQALWASDFGLEQCLETEVEVRATWQEARNRLLTKLEEVNPIEPPADPHRLRIGMYMYFEPTPSTNSNGE